MINNLINYIKTLPFGSAVTIVVMVTIIMALTKLKSIINFTKWAVGKSSKKKRTCGDCVLIIFSIRELYEFQREKLRTNLLRQQMTYVEQKIQEVIMFLAQNFNDDIKLLGKDATNNKRVSESALYCESLKNSLLEVKDEIRRSFKENGFAAMSEKEYAQYVKEKAKILVMSARSYLRQYCVETDETIIKLKDRFDKMDKWHFQQFEGWAFDIFTNAKDLIIETERKRVNLDEKFKKDIDNFVNDANGNTGNSCDSTQTP